MIKALNEHPDRELLEQLKSGSEKALKALHTQYFVKLCKIAFEKLKDEQLVEELVQDVFLNIWQKRDNLDVNGNVMAYLYATLRNKALHELRAKMIQSQHYKQIELQHPSCSESLEDDYVVKETEARIKQVIGTLPVKCQQAFKLSRFECLSNKEIAERMGISVNTVEKHIGKALRILGNEIKGCDVSVITLIGLLELYRL